MRKVVRYLTMEIFQTSVGDRRKSWITLKTNSFGTQEKTLFSWKNFFFGDRTDTSKMTVRISPRKLPHEENTTFWWEFTTVNFEKSVVAHKNYVSRQNHCFSVCQMNWSSVFTQLFLLSPTDVWQFFIFKYLTTFFWFVLVFHVPTPLRQKPAS